MITQEALQHLAKQAVEAQEIRRKQIPELGIEYIFFPDGTIKEHKLPAAFEQHNVYALNEFIDFAKFWKDEKLTIFIHHDGVTAIKATAHPESGTDYSHIHYSFIRTSKQRNFKTLCISDCISIPGENYKGQKLWKSAFKFGLKDVFPEDLTKLLTEIAWNNANTINEKYEQTKQSLGAQNEVSYSTEKPISESTIASIKIFDDDQCPVSQIPCVVDVDIEKHSIAICAFKDIYDTFVDAVINNWIEIIAKETKIPRDRIHYGSPNFKRAY